jgi:formylglycine-generating enzyme required for sulfatase activity
MCRTATLIIAVAALVALSGSARLRVDAAAGAPDMIELAPHAFLYPLDGQFTRGGKPVVAPAHEMRPAHALAIMRRQVTAAEYRRCIADGGCRCEGSHRCDGG